MRPLLVVGSINIDISLRVPRLALEGETLMGQDLQISPGGKGANQAHAARCDGAEVCLVGAVGQDAFAQPALQRLRSSGVQLHAVRALDGATTGTALIQVTDAGDNAIALAPGANALLQPHHLAEQVAPDTWASHDLLLQWELPPQTTLHAAALARAAGSRVILNAAPAQQLGTLDPGLLDWCILNAGELHAWGERLGLGPAGPAAARALARQVGHGVVLTLGAQGLYACPRPGGPAHEQQAPAASPGLVETAALAAEGRAAGLPLEGLHLRAHPVAAVDSTGAGDTFCGVFAAALAAGRTVQQALRRANAAAALACTARGAQAAQPLRHQIDHLLTRGC